MVRTIFTFLLVIFSISFSYSQLFSEVDVEKCDSIFQISVDKNLSQKPINEVLVEIGKSFIGTEYLAHGLETDGDEQLVINLLGLDCTTFVENVLALSRCVKEKQTSFEDYSEELQFIRYRDGIINGYPSRLHYFSDWIYNNVSKGIVEDITEQIVGKAIQFKLNFMSTHPESYKQLNENPDLIPQIKIQEEEISSRIYYYIPKDEVELKEKFINEGDIIAITTTVEGLDIGHLGIAVKMDDERIHLLHHQLLILKYITKEPLSDYLMKYKRHSGVIVLKPLNLRPYLFSI